MDKRYYYSVLGLREGASTSEIKKAYTKRMQKLKSADYADDPEYVAKKMDQARHAYNVLMGGARPETEHQKNQRFEEWKDAEDGGEDTIQELKEKFQKHIKKCKLVSGSKKSSKGFGTMKPVMAPVDKQALMKVFSSILSLIIFMGVAIGGCSSIFDEGMLLEEPQYVEGELYENFYDLSQEAIEALTEERVDMILAWNQDFDYYGNLDTSTIEDCKSDVIWEPEDSELEWGIWDQMDSINYHLDLYSNSETITYITGDANFYWDNNDFERAMTLVSIMDPPMYEEIAGSVDLYNGIVILTYTDYFRFLDSVAEDQIDYVAGYTDWDYYYNNY